jgi:hypothetical protein
MSDGNIAVFPKPTVFNIVDGGIKTGRSGRVILAMARKLYPDKTAPEIVAEILAAIRELGRLEAEPRRLVCRMPWDPEITHEDLLAEVTAEVMAEVWGEVMAEVWGEVWGGVLGEVWAEE